MAQTCLLLTLLQEYYLSWKLDPLEEEFTVMRIILEGFS